MNKKVKILIRILAITMIALLTIFFINDSRTSGNVNFGGNSISNTDALGAFALNNKNEFINMNPNTLINEGGVLAGTGFGAQQNAGLYWRTSACLYHNAAGPINYSVQVSNIIDFDVNSNGEYVATSYPSGKKVSNLDVARLGAAIDYAVNDSTADGGGLTYTTKASRLAIYRYFYQALGSGSIDIGTWFNRNAIFNYVELARASTIREIENNATAIRNYKQITKNNNNEDVKVVSISSNHAILGPFVVNYNGKGVQSVTVEGANNATVQFATSKDATEWKSVTEIPKNTKFYLKITNANLAPLNYIKVTFNQAPVSYYKARLILTRALGTAGAQSLAYYSSVRNTKNANIKYEVKNNPGVIIVNKTDPCLNKKLNIGFKVQTKNQNNEEKWLKDNGDGTYNYDASFETATEFATTEGTKKIEHLSIMYQYRVWETKAPSGETNNNYRLEDQEGYDDTLKAVKLSDWGNPESNDNCTITLNANNYGRTSISGYVWIEKKAKEDQEYDSIYIDKDNGDIRLPEVIVNLVNKETKQIIATTSTDNKGEYYFDEPILYKDLDNYYVEFDYSNMTIEGRSGKEYITANYNSNNLKDVVENGSRAMMDIVAKKDTDLSGIASTYTGVDPNYLATYGLRALAENTQGKKLYNAETNTLEYINLGLKPIYEPEYRLDEDLKYVKIVLNNHEYIYGYGDEQLSMIDAAPTVSKEHPAYENAYSRPIYPSAIYNLQDESANTNGKIKVYVVYEMLITNLTLFNEENLYQEKELHITSLTNKFDTNRYTFDSTVNQIKGTDSKFIELENKIQGDFTKWNVEGDTATYKEEIVIKKGDKDNEYLKNDNALKYIQFRVNDDEIIRILNNQDGLFENKPTTAQTDGYHLYSRNDYSWNTLPTEPKMQDHESKYQHDVDYSRYLKFSLGKERKVTGTVFEDTVSMEGRQEGEVLGNGRYENDKENAVSGVIVELVSGNNKFEEATVNKLYVASEDRKTYTISDASIKTGNDGRFELEGIMPGDYFLRLTYGDGTQKIMNADGTIVSIDDYKSTIVTSDAARKALGYADNEHGKEWYKYVEEDNYSVAVDSLTMREEHNSTEKQDKMFAGTALLDITIENTKTNYTSAKEALDKETFYGFNFGIILQPKQRVNVNNKITNVKLVNTPNNIFDGNPETDSLSGVTDLDGIENKGSTYTRMEVEETNIYGSDLTLTYNIEIVNASDKNYYEAEEKYKGWYYMFGDNSHSKPVKIKVDEVVDCYDPVLTYISNNERISEISKDNSVEWNDEKRIATINEQTKLANQKQEGKYNFEKALLITGWDKLLGIGDSEDITLEFRKTLSNQDEDLDFINVAGLSKAENVTELIDKEKDIAIKTVKYIRPAILSEAALSEATVTTPTGNNKQVVITTIVIASIAILSIAGIGIITFKKRK